MNGLMCCLDHLIKTIKTFKSDHTIFEDHKYINETLNGCCNVCNIDENNEQNENNMIYIKDLRIKDYIFEKFLQAIDILNDSDVKNVLKKFYSFENCQCITEKNSLKCCLKILNKSNLSTIECCKKCYFQRTIKPEHFDDESKIQKAKDKFRRSFFGELISSTESGGSSSSDGQDENEITEQKLNSEENSKINHVPKLELNSATPRKAIIKKSSTSHVNVKQENSKKLGNNSARKSVTFIEDPKHGLIPVEIPEWQEKLREPVYSKKYMPSLPEWKK